MRLLPVLFDVFDIGLAWLNGRGRRSEDLFEKLSCVETDLVSAGGNVKS